MGQHDHERSEFLRQWNFPEFFIILIFNFFDLFLKIKIKGIEGALSSCAPNFSKGRNFPQFFRGGDVPLSFMESFSKVKKPLVFTKRTIFRTNCWINDSLLININFKYKCWNYCPCTPMLDSINIEINILQFQC